MSSENPAGKPAKVEAGVKLRGAEKVARIPVKILPCRVQSRATSPIAI